MTLKMQAIARLARSLVAFALLCVSITVPARAGPGHAPGEGHDHDGQAATVVQSPRVIATSENFQLVGILKNGRLTLFLDRDADNAPVQDAKITVKSGETVLVAERAIDGTYVVPATTIAMPGENELQFEIQVGAEFDLLGGILTVPDRAKAPLPAPARLLERLTTTTVVGGAALVGALLLGALVGSLFSRRLAIVVLTIGAANMAVVSLEPARAGPGHAPGEGHDHGPEANAGASDLPRRLPDGSVFLPKPTQRLLEVRTRRIQTETVRRTVRLPGRVVANPVGSAVVQSTVDGRIAPVNGRFPQIGQTVQAGQILAVVRPVLAAIDRSDVEQTAGNLEQQVALAQNKLDQFRKFSSTFPAERIKTAEIELEGLLRRKAMLNRGQVGAEELVAPIDGVILSSQVQIGQVVSSKDILFNIVQPHALWVEALAYENVDVATLGAARSMANDHAAAELKLMGANPGLAQHATILKFEIVGKADGFRLGRNVSVFVETDAPISGLVLPRAAVVQAPNGQYVVFRHIEPERFEPVAIKFVEIDATRTLVTAGIEAGEKIAVEAASLINQIR